MDEMVTVTAIRRLCPTAPEQKNEIFDCDAELVEMASGLHGITIDEFSEEEDFFNNSDPVSLGSDLAVATMSDLLAAGCEPRFYLHSIVEPKGRDDFAVELSRGVQKILTEAGAFLLGGDLGRGHSWRYTGAAIGLSRLPRGRRLIPPRRQKLWLTGTLGDGNLRAMTNGAGPPFELRLAEAGRMKGVATAAIDTSGGLGESLSILQRLNPGFSFTVNPESLPFDPSVRRFAEDKRLPLAGFAFGGAGEYELLFTADEDAPIDFAANIGTVVPDGAGRIFWGARRLDERIPDPRTFRDFDGYLEKLMGFSQGLL